MRIEKIKGTHFGYAINPNRSSVSGSSNNRKRNQYSLKILKNYIEKNSIIISIIMGVISILIPLIFGLIN